MKLTATKEQERKALENTIEDWATRLMQRSYDVSSTRTIIYMCTNTPQDPVLKQRVIKLVVDISSRALDKHPSFALKVLEHILMTRLQDHPEFPAYSESVKELHGLASHELRRLAIRYADYFAVRLLLHFGSLTILMLLQTFYDLLEPKITEITLANRVDDKLQMELTSILLIIM